MYVVYCQNKPRSEFIVIEYETYFEVMRRFSFFFFHFYTWLFFSVVFFFYYLIE